MVNEELNALTKLFNTSGIKLFIVGGYVRDSILGLNPTDIDLASELVSDKVEELLKNTGFSVKLASKKLGTLIISKNGKEFEYTTFRSESYKDGGYHTPDKVDFVSNIEIDAKRRDFTINSLYYDLQEEKVIDFFNGEHDLKTKKVKAIISPKYVFKSDGLRILRMIRFAGELNFKIDGKTFRVAKKLVNQLNDVSKDRIFKEFYLTLIAKDKYRLENNNVIKKFNELGAIEYVFPNLRALSINHNYKKLLKGYYKSLYYFNFANSDLKFATFILDLCLHLNRFDGQKPSVTAHKILNPKTSGISLTKKNFTINLIKAYEQSKKIDADYGARSFLQDHNAIIEELFVILNNDRDRGIYGLLKDNFDYMVKHSMPFKLKELKIDGNMLKDECKFILDEKMGEALHKALKFAIREPNNNAKAKIIKFLKGEK